MGSSISSIHIPLAVMHDSPKRKASKSLGGTIGIPKSNREKKQDLVATGILGGTGILPVILGRLASRPYSLSYHSVLPSDPIRYGCKTFENCDGGDKYNGNNSSPCSYRRGG
jgi:hypothetical protein